MLRIATWVVGSALSAGALAGLGAPGAHAADVIGRAPAYAPAPVVTLPNWAGFYIGGQVGLGTDSVRFQNLGPSAAFSPPGAVARDHNDGIIGGGQVGYNFQTGNVVLGVEGSLSAASFDGSFTSPFKPATGTFSDRPTWLGTVTGRVGYAMGDWLPYVKGGLATAKLDTRIQDVGIGGFSSGSSQHTGYTAGGGVEYRLNPKWSLGLEYMYSDLGRSTDISGPQTSLASGAPIPGTSESYSTGLRSQSLMGRLNYKIGW